jgi:putative endopeptidase
MIRHILAAGVSAAAIALALPVAAQDAESALPKIVTGTWGVDIAQLDATVDPGDDFNAYVNGKWIAAHPIPAEFPSMGQFTILRDEAATNVRALVQDLVDNPPAAGTSERRIVDSYNAFLDTAAIDAAGMAPAQPYLEKIFDAPDLAALIAVSASPGFPTLVGPGVTIDDKNPGSYALTMGFSGMGLPDRDYYLVDSEENLEIRAAYKDFLAFVLGKSGYENPATVAEAVYAFEHQVAELEWAPIALRNADLTYHLLSRDEVQALAPAFPLDTVLRTATVSDADSFIVPQLPPTDEERKQFGLGPEFEGAIGGGLPAMMKLIANTPLPTLKAYLAAQFISDKAAILPSDVDEARFAVYDKLIAGRNEQQPRWKRSIASTTGQLGELLGSAYVERHFPPSSKAQMEQLVQNLVVAMQQNIAGSTWMSAGTKTQARAKLDAFLPRIGYTDKFKTYDNLVITPDNPVANAMAAAAWNWQDDLAHLGKPVDRLEWPYVPQTVNASYSTGTNSITFPAGILQPPFFNPSADPAVNYGAIGVVIGHEIGHGFDDQGSKYDGTGKLENWWTESDRTAFDALTDKLVAQYNTYCPVDDGKTCVNGRLTLGENIGDLVGMEMAYRAYHLSLDGKEAPVIDGLTGDQRFFLAYAQVWRTAYRDAALRNQMLTDPHSPAMFRVNGVVRNVDAWYKAFNVTPDDELYLPPEERVHIW